MKNLKTFGALVCLLFAGALVCPAAAQNVDASRADVLQTTQPPFGQPGVVASSPNDADIGVQAVVAPTARYQPFTVSGGTSLFYTSNVALTPSHEFGDLIISPGAAIAYQPRFTDNLYGLLDFRQQFFYYADHSSFNFGSTDVDAGLSILLPELHGLVVRGQYHHNLLTDSDLDHELFKNHAIVLSADMPFKLDQAQQFSLGGDASISVAAHPDFARRNEYEAYAAYAIALTREFSLNAIGRFVVHDYDLGGRNDLSEVLWLTANYRFAPWCVVSAISSFAHNDSNRSGFDYNVANVGGALSLTIRF